MDELSQTRLAIAIRYAVDVARRTGRSYDIDRALELVSGNPHNYRSTHVQYNIGLRRQRWIEEQLRVRAG